MVVFYGVNTFTQFKLTKIAAKLKVVHFYYIERFTYLKLNK